MNRSISANAHVAIRIAVAGSMIFFIGSAARAHHIWMMADQDGGQLATHVAFGDLDKRELPDAKRIVSMELVSAAGKEDLRTGLSAATYSGHPVLDVKASTPPAGAVISIVYDNGFWLKQKNDKTETNTSPLLAPDGANAHWTVKYGKILLGPGSWERVLNTRLEFVPLKDPYSVPIGQTLPVRLVLNGKPVPETIVQYSDGVTAIPDAKLPWLQTDAEGVVQLPLTRKGSYMLTADPNAPSLHPALVKHDHVYASLTFDLAKQ